MVRAQPHDNLDPGDLRTLRRLRQFERVDRNLRNVDQGIAAFDEEMIVAGSC